MILKINVKSDGHQKRIMAAEKALREAGITFDTGMRFSGAPKGTREWFLDVSLKGAELVDKEGGKVD